MAIPTTLKSHCVLNHITKLVWHHWRTGSCLETHTHTHRPQQHHLSSSVVPMSSSQLNTHHCLLQGQKVTENKAPMLFRKSVYVCSWCLCVCICFVCVCVLVVISRLIFHSNCRIRANLPDVSITGRLRIICLIAANLLPVSPQAVSFLYSCICVQRGCQPFVLHNCQKNVQCMSFNRKGTTRGQERIWVM